MLALASGRRPNRLDHLDPERLPRWPHGGVLQRSVPLVPRETAEHLEPLVHFRHDSVTHRALFRVTLAREQGEGRDP